MFFDMFHNEDVFYLQVNIEYKPLAFREWTQIVEELKRIRSVQSLVQPAGAA